MYGLVDCERLSRCVGGVIVLILLDFLKATILSYITCITRQSSNTKKVIPALI